MSYKTLKIDFAVEFKDALQLNYLKQQPAGLMLLLSYRFRNSSGVVTQPNIHVGGLDNLTNVKLMQQEQLDQVSITLITELM